MKTTQELQAMISLLDDPDDLVYDQIKSELLTRGRPALPELENAIIQNTCGPIIKKRIREVIKTIKFEETAAALNQWMSREDKEIIDAMCIIGRYQYSGINEEVIYSTIDEFVRYLSVEMKEYNTAYEKIKVINRLLFKDFGLTGNTDNYFALENCFINKLIETKMGNPISLSALYLTIARRAGVPVYGVNLPHHFILAYLDQDSPLGLAEMQNRVLFYINPFNKGIVFGRDEIEEFLRQLDITPVPAHYKPCMAGEFIRSYLNNIISTCKKEGYDRKAEEYRQMLKLLSDQG